MVSLYRLSLVCKVPVYLQAMECPAGGSTGLAVHPILELSRRGKGPGAREIDSLGPSAGPRNQAKPYLSHFMLESGRSVRTIIAAVMFDIK